MGSGAFQFDKKKITANWAFTETTAGGGSSMEDFFGLGATLADNPKVLISQSGTPATVAAVSSAVGIPTGHGGWVSGATQAVDAEIDEIALGKKPWLVPNTPGINGVYAEIGFVIPTALTARQYFFGLADDETEGTATNGALNIATALTLTSVIDDGCGFIFSSLATNPTHFKIAGTAATVDTTVTDSVLVAVAARYIKLRVEVDSALVGRFYGGVGASATDNRYTVSAPLLATKAACSATLIPLLPLFTAAPTTTTSVPYHIDYIAGGPF